MNNMRLDNFFVLGRKIDEVLILMIFPNFRPPVVEKVDKPERRFFVGLVDSLA